MYFFDPEYVTQMRVPGFDPHIDVAVLAGLMTKEEAVFYKEYNRLKDANPKHEFSKEDLDLAFKIVSARNIAKRVNFAGIYGAGPPKIAQSTGMPLVQAQKLHKTYWERNKAVKLVSKYVKFKTVEFDGVEQMWLFNPISQFWYSLRYEKDIFSTLNQGSGVYCFDMWLKEVRSRGIKVRLQYHDEIVFQLNKNDTEISEKILMDSIAQVNNILKLNVPLGVSVDFGNNYAEIH